MDTFVPWKWKCKRIWDDIQLQFFFLFLCIYFMRCHSWKFFDKYSCQRKCTENLSMTSG